MRTFLFAVVLFGAVACAGSSESSPATDSTSAPVADSTSTVADTTVVTPVTEGEAAK
jgi:hypothetical protein